MKKLDFHCVKGTIRNNLFVLRLIFETIPVYGLFICVSTIIHEIIVFIEHTYMIKYITDSIQYSRPFSGVLRFVLVVFVIVAIWFILNSYIYAYLSRKSNAALQRKLQLQFYAKAAELDLDCYDNPEFYNDFVWGMSELTSRTEKVLYNTSELLGSISAILISGIMMLNFDKGGLIFVAFSFVATFGVNIIVNKLRFNLDNELKPKQRKRDYINRVFYLNDFAKEIRLSSIKDKLYKDFVKSNEDISATIKGHTKRIMILTFLKDYLLNSFILDGLYILYLMYRALVKKVISYGTMIALFNVSWKLKSGLQRFTKVLPEFQQNSLYIDKIRKFLEYEPCIKDKGEVHETPAEPAVLKMENVSFAYNEKDKLILKNINLTINPKEKIAFVGYNGAGKTTLVKLLMRLYDVTGGKITYDGRSLEDYRVKSYRDSFGTVFQDYQLFAATIAENVIMDTTDIDENNVKKALDQSGFTRKLEALEKGMYSQITTEFDEHGINLSGGEAQKIAIARVFYKPCQIIILDEPSSALDPISEYHLNEAMMKAAEDKTVIFISHRLSTTKMADRIFMLENGEIIEQGSHDELMRLNGKYAAMFNMQAEKYRQSAFMVNAG